MPPVTLSPDTVSDGSETRTNPGNKPGTLPEPDPQRLAEPPRFPEPFLAPPPTAPTVAAAEVTATEVAATEVTTAEVTTAEVTTAEMTTAEMTTAEMTTAEMTSPEVAAVEVAAGQRAAEQPELPPGSTSIQPLASTHSGKLPLASSIVRECGGCHETIPSIARYCLYCGGAQSPGGQSTPAAETPADTTQAPVLEVVSDYPAAPAPAAPAPEALPSLLASDVIERVGRARHDIDTIGQDLERLSRRKTGARPSLRSGSRA